MAIQDLLLGTIANDGTGDPLRVGGLKIKENFTELYDTFKLRSYTIYLSGLLDEIAILFDANTTITSITLGNITTIQYSLNGINWNTWTGTPVNFAIGTIKLRASAFNTGFSDGAIIVKGNLT